MQRDTAPADEEAESFLSEQYIYIRIHMFRKVFYESSMKHMRREHI